MRQPARALAAGLVAAAGALAGCALDPPPAEPGAARAEALPPAGAGSLR